MWKCPCKNPKSFDFSPHYEGLALTWTSIFISIQYAQEFNMLVMTCNSGAVLIVVVFFFFQSTGGLYVCCVWITN